MSTLNPAGHLVTTHEPAAAHAHGAHHEIGFLRKYVFSTDHKIIGIQFLITTLLMFLVGGALALGVRWQLAFPWREMPIIGRLLFSAQGGAISPEFYTMLFTMHATVMIFLVIIPILAGAFGNFLIPLQIGADDMAFPTLNMLSYWFMWPAIGFFMASFFVTGGAAAAGWTSYPTLSALPQAAPGSGLGQTLWLMGVTFVGFSSMMGSVNYMTTIINMRAPGMTLFRMPMTIWAMFITAILQAFALPVLTAAGFMLLFERTLGMTFFVPGGLVVNNAPATVGGGQALLWQHLFWFYSHPAVYIMILARDGDGVGHDFLLLPQAPLRLPADGLLDRRHRRAGFHRLGPPHVHQRHEPGAGHDLHDFDDHDRPPLGGEDVQLAGNDVGRRPAIHRPHAEFHRVRRRCSWSED